MYKQYPIFIEAPQSKNEAWGIIVPDMPGCHSAADNEEDILKNAREAIALWLEDAEELPHALSLNMARAKKYGDNVTLAFIDVDVSAFEGKKKRINVSIPESLIESIDRVSGNRSAFLAQAAREKLAHAH